MVYTGLTNPSQTDATYISQSGYDPGQQKAILAGILGCGLISGCAVTSNANMSPSVAAGVIVGPTGVQQAVGAGTVTIGAADSVLSRIDLIVAAYATGVKSVIAGTFVVAPDDSHPGPSWPNTFDPTTHAVLAEVYVAAGIGAIAANCLVDKRVFPNQYFALDTELATEITNRATADTAEATARAAADTAEATARIAGDASEATARATAITAEATTRAAADTTEASARATAVTAEATARTTADNLRQLLSEKNQPNGYAGLDGSGLLPTTALPALAISEFLGMVASQAAMLALSGQRGDWCIRSDRSSTFILTAEPSSTLGNWKELPSPAVVGGTYINAKASPYSAIGNVENLYVSVTAGSPTCTLLGDWLTVLGLSGYPAYMATRTAFTAADVGKKFVIPGGGAAGAGLIGTFTAFVDATHMTMSVSAGTTVANTQGEGSNSNYPSCIIGNDDTAAIQAAIDVAYALEEAGLMVGATVLIPAGAYFVKGLKLKTGVRVIGEGMSTQLWAAPDSGTTPTIYLGDPQSASKQSCYRFGLESLSVYGLRQGKVACRAIDFTINTEVWQNFQGGGPNDVNATVRDVYVHDSGGDVAVFFGTNVRGLYVDDLRIMSSGFSGLTIATTDCVYHALSIGSSGMSETGATARWGLKVTGKNNRISDGKFWYPQNTNGDGVYIAADGNWFANCETQDNSRYGWVLDTVRACSLAGCVAGGDLTASLLLIGPSYGNRIDLGIKGADRWQTKAGVIIDGTGGSPSGNAIELLAGQISDLDASYKQIIQQNGGTAALNLFRSQLLRSDMGQFITPSAGNLACDLANGPVIVVLLTANITLIQVANVTGTGSVPGSSRVTFVFIQDATGGRTVGWNAIWGTGVPAVSGTANAITTISFIAYGGSPTAPSWQHT